MTQYLEYILILLMMIGLAKTRLSVKWQYHLYFAGFLMGLWGLFRFVIGHDPSSMIWSHPLAFAHIIFCQTALIITMMCVISALLFLPVHLKRLIQIALIYQGIGISLGMFWAYDAPDWGHFWQWDLIEISALYVWISLYTWSHTTPDNRKTWATTVLFLVFLQTMVLYAGIVDDSRHGYSVTQQLPVFVGWIVFLGVLGIARRFLSKLKDKNALTIQDVFNIDHHKSIKIHIERVCAWIISGTVIFCILGYRNDTALYLLSLLLWLVLTWCHATPQKRFYTGWLCAAGIITTVLLMFLPIKIQDQWIRANMHENQLSLQGVELMNADECYQYRFGIGMNDTDLTHIGLSLCQDKRIPETPVYYITMNPLSCMRIQALDYQANQGVLLRIRDCRLDMLFALWFVLTLIIGMICLYRNRMEVSDKL